MTIKEQLTALVSEAFAACGYPPEYGAVSGSNRPDLCQFQCNGAMTAAKILKKPPMAIAGEVAERLRDTDIFSSVAAVPPGFINMDISDELLVGYLTSMAADPRLLLPLMERKTIVVDYGGPNVAKPLHIGHLRTAIIGDSLCRIARFLGHNVIGDAHFGDWGLQMGLVITGLQQRRPELVYFDAAYTGDYPVEPPVSVDELNEIYPAASAKSKTDPDFAARAAAATVELQNRRAGYIALWKQIWNVSMADLKKNYDILGVHFDYWLSESDADEFIPLVMERLRERGLLRESDGALVVDVALPDDREPMPPMLVTKSNGGDIYGTTDLGTLWQRKRDWDPDEIWYVVDERQSFHFKQLFRCAALAGITGDTVCTHVWFGTMKGKDGKPFKTREGGVMRMSDLIEMVTNAALEKAKEGAVSDDGQMREEVAQTVGVAALKVGDMVNHRTKDVVFDMGRFLASEGKTGPYLQYSAVRLASVLSKAEERGLPSGPILPPSGNTERELMLSLIGVNEILLRAFEEK
ncbi:MAG: arginine--tRNA ligase, partial [Oscillospiraceae bacterium]|nr:arginine--tRNA ligase [Oscillospiraceae bacterium]